MVNVLVSAGGSERVTFPYAVSVYVNAVQQSSSWLDEFSFMMHNCLLS